MSLEHSTRVVEAILGRGQDCVVVDDLPQGGLSIRVADGAGGVAGSEGAARFICGPVGPRHPLYGWLAWMGGHISYLSRLGTPRGIAAAVVLEISNGNQISGTSVGDCGAWIFDLDGMPAMELTSGQRRKPLLGEDGAEPVGFEGDLWGGMLVVATDGLWKYADLPSCAATMRLAISNPLFPLDTLADALIDSARLPTGALQDDIALAIVARR
jgi:serine/threonine protein phosphatase PrpC